jgi:hypothetical protein
MSSGFKKTAAAIVMSALVMTPIATASLVLTTEAAFAKSGKSKGASEGRAKGKSSTRSTGTRSTRISSRGAIASELKNLNAVNSWKNGQGYLHASANSKIGMITTYDNAEYSLSGAEMAYDDYVAGFYPTDAYECFDETDAFTCEPTSFDEAALWQEILDYEAALVPFQDAVDATTDKFDLAFEAIGADELSPDALLFFNNALGFGF